MHDEANVLVESLLADEHEPERRAKLVALKLALGFPHALEIDPALLAELRAHQLDTSRPALRLQALLAAASVVAALWCVGGLLWWGWLTWGDHTLVVIFVAFLIGLVHAGVGLAEGCARGVDRRALALLAWMWLFGPTMSLAVGIGFDVDAMIAGLICAVPSTLVSLCASLLARRLPR